MNGEATEENGEQDDLHLTETSTIDPSFIIRSVIKLLPKRFQKRLELSSSENKDGNLESLLDIILDPMQTDITPDDKDSASEELDATNPSDEENEKIDAGCIIWDLSCSEEHSLFLCKHHVLPAIHSIILNSESHTPRLLEICIGILGNLCSVDELCEKILRYELVMPQSKPISLLSSIESLLFQSHDPMVLSELMRLLTVGICCKRIYGASSSPNNLQSNIVKTTDNNNEQPVDSNTISSNNGNNNNNADSNVDSILVGTLWMDRLAGKRTTLERLLSILSNTLNAGLMERTSALILYLLHYDHLKSVQNSSDSSDITVQSEVDKEISKESIASNSQDDHHSSNSNNNNINNSDSNYPQATTSTENSEKSADLQNNNENTTTTDANTDNNKISPSSDAIFLEVGIIDIIVEILHSTGNNTEKTVLTLLQILEIYTIQSSFFSYLSASISLTNVTSFLECLVVVIKQFRDVWEVLVPATITIANLCIDNPQSLIELFKKNESLQLLLKAFPSEENDEGFESAIWSILNGVLDALPAEVDSRNQLYMVIIESANRFVLQCKTHETTSSTLLATRKQILLKILQSVEKQLDPQKKGNNPSSKEKFENAKALLQTSKTLQQRASHLLPS